jgi:hypothetical protein
MMRQPGKTLNPAETSECPIDDPSTRKRSLAAPFAACLAIAIVFLSPVVAQAISFGLEYRDSTYQVVGSDTYDDLVLEFQSGTLLSTQTISGLDGLTSTAYAGTNNDYATLITTTFIAGVTGTYEFLVGTDWGRGGAVQAVDVSSGSVLDTFVTTNDIWWGNNWSNPDVFSTVLNLTVGETYSLGWVGFEGCCGGAASFRFSIDGSAPQTLNSTNFLPFEQPSPVPEPGTALLVGLGLAWLSVAARTGKKPA